MRRLPHVSETYMLGGILLVTLIHGLLYLFLVPPWMHYDEPNHFEYAWLIARWGRLPELGEYDPEMHREVARSMIEHGFFHTMSFTPDLNVTDQPIWIGSYSQLGDPPAYYLLAAMPVILFPSADVTTQLYLMRLLSLGLLLLTVTAAWGVTAELTAPGSALRWMTPLSMALLPSFADLMTAVNSDVAAVAFFSLFLWGSVRLIRRGFSWPAFLLTALTAGICFFTKANVMLAAPLWVVVIGLSLTREHGRRWVWATIALMAVAAAVAMFHWGEVAYWYRNPLQGDTRRIPSPEPSLGQRSFAVRGGAFQQLIPLDTAYALQGKAFTLGAWVWADQPAVVQAPVIHVYEGNQDFSADWPVTTTPTFRAFSAILPDRIQRMWLIFASQGEALYFDGIVLCEGDWTQLDPSAWQCPNLIRNPSAEADWPGVRPWADALAARLLPDKGQLSVILYTVLDGDATAWYYQANVNNLFRSFWAKFGWGSIALVGKRPYRLLGVATLAGVLGAAWALKRRSLPWSALLFLGMGLVAVWGMTLTRGAIYMLIQARLYAVARYAYPVLIPTMLVLTAGWQQGGSFLERRLRIPAWVLASLFGCFWLILDGWALYSLLTSEVLG